MNISINNSSETPIYLQIVEHFTANIRNGLYPPGFKLPTVRQLCKKSGVSQGTIKHAYDILEQLELVEKTQGRGTFVSSSSKDKNPSKKEQAINAIDKLISELTNLGFSTKEIRIYFDLKMREKDYYTRSLKIGAIDCNVEALSVMSGQIATLPNVDVYEYPLSPILDKDEYFDPKVDIMVTTHTHYYDLQEKLTPDQKLIKMVMAVSKQTVMELARIDSNANLGILCSSKKFAHIILKACKEYCLLTKPINIAYFGDGNINKIIDECDKIILPKNYHRFCSKDEYNLIGTIKKPIIYEYHIERGSLIYLEEQTEKMYKQIQNKINI